ncbi:MAG TPA: hypothetical protein VF532_05890 [Candidatus Angelobacter sp.]
MSLRSIIDAHLSIAQSTGKIAKLYKHKVWNVDEAQMRSLFVDSTNGRIDVCFISPEAVPANDLGPNNNYRLPSIVLYWYRSMSRAADDSQNTEDGFLDDMEAVKDAFDANRRLTTGAAPNQVHNAAWSTAMETRKVDYVMFQGALCHYAELVHTVKDGPRSTTSS